MLSFNYHKHFIPKPYSSNTMSELAKKRIAEAMAFNSTFLNLGECELKELNEIPELFDLLPNLQSLDLSYNELTCFSIVGVFPHLESLILHSNQLTIAPNLQCFPHLRHLDLNGNQK
ncbi:MAG: leucine-rich repeat domain-containing protein [Chitinophagales bacterium]